VRECPGATSGETSRSKSQGTLSTRRVGNLAPRADVLSCIVLPKLRRWQRKCAELPLTVPFTLEQAYYEQGARERAGAISIIDQDLKLPASTESSRALFGLRAEAAGETLDQLIAPPDRYAETA